MTSCTVPAVVAAFPYVKIQSFTVRNEVGPLDYLRGKTVIKDACSPHKP